MSWLFSPFKQLFYLPENRTTPVMMAGRKRRQESGDSLAGSSGYGSASEHSILGEDTSMSEEEAMKVLELNKANGCPLQECKNSNRGCQVKTYPKILGLHEEFCKFPEIRKLTVRSKLNFFQAHEEKFSIFCQSFENREVLFMYKKTKDKDSVRICAQSSGEETFFSMTFYDQKERHIHKIAGKTGLKIHLIPGRVFKEVGHLVKYKILLTK